MLNYRTKNGKEAQINSQCYVVKVNSSYRVLGAYKIHQQSIFCPKYSMNYCSLRQMINVIMAAFRFSQKYRNSKINLTLNT